VRAVVRLAVPREFDERHPHVLTTRDFNRLGDVLVAPITQGGDFSRFAGFAVPLSGTGCKTRGVALVNKIRMMDLSTRKAKKSSGRRRR